MKVDRNTRTLFGLVGVVVVMGALAWAAVPFYSWFCRVTGYGGTTQVSEVGSDVVLDRTVREGTRRIVVDLGATEFVDSSGLGALIGGLKTARQAGGDLRLAAAGEQVRTVLALTNLDRILRPHPGVEDAARGW